MATRRKRNLDGENNTLTMPSDIDELLGLGGNDTLRGRSGEEIDMLRGGAGHDHLHGVSGGINYLYGEAGNDTLESGGGWGILYGGTGHDFLEGSDNYDWLHGGDGNDYLRGLSAPDHLYGNAGNDTLHGGGGDDHLEGGAGDDILTGRYGHDELDGGTGNDHLYGGDGNDILEGGAGNDNLYGWSWEEGKDGKKASNRDRPLNDLDADTLRGGNGNDNLYGEAGDDHLDGGAGNDNLYGGEGDDILEGRAGNDNLYGEVGSDTASYAYSAGGVTVNLGAPDAAGYVAGTGGDAQGDRLKGIENLRGSAHNDTLTGDSGDNILEGGAGAEDTLDGGAGKDTASYAGSTGGVTVNLGATPVDGWIIGTGGDAAGDKLKNIENLRGSAHNDTLTGDSGDNILEGGAGAEDTLDGGAGKDTASYAGSTGGVTVNLGATPVDGWIIGTGGDAAGDKLKNIENLRGSAHNDTLTGDSGDNILEGGAGAEDTLDGGAGKDTASYAGSTGGVTVNLGATPVDGWIIGTGGDAAGDKLKNIENLRGSAHNDTLTGDSGDNILEGEDGDDILEGGAGTRDTLDGGGGSDTASYKHSAGGVTVNLGATPVDGWIIGTGGDAAGDKLKNIENLRGSAKTDTLTGNNAANRLEGLGSIDYLYGGGGNDELDGGVGDDYLYGEAGEDHLVGSYGSDRLDGGSENDVLEGGEDDDALIGGAGSDTASYEHSAGGVTVDLTQTGAQAGTQTTNYDAAGDTLREIENLRGSAHNDTLTGDSGDNILEGGAGAEDTLDGGAGKDTASYAGSTGGVTVNLGATPDEEGYIIITKDDSEGDAAGDKLKNIDNLRGSAHNDTLTGDRGDNILEGEDGDDILEGGAGVKDTLDGGAGSDTASYAGSTGGVTVNLGATPVDGWIIGTGGDAQGDRLKNIENLRGSAQTDRLTGDGTANKLEGGAGADTLSGSGGNDVLEGGGGGDTLTGGAGEDRLVGGTGSDLLTGGADADTFVFEMGSVDVTDSDTILKEETDVVTDFTQSEGDKLDFSGLKEHPNFKGTELFFRGTGAFTTSADGQVQYSYRGDTTDTDTTNDRLYTDVTVDVDGDGDADFQVTLAGEHYTLTVSDMLGVEVS